MRRVVLHVDRLVLRGIARADAAAVTAGLQAELHRVLGTPEVVEALAAGGNPSRVTAREVRIVQRRGATAVGRACAGGIMRAVMP